MDVVPGGLLRPHLPCSTHDLALGHRLRTPLIPPGCEPRPLCLYHSVLVDWALGLMLAAGVVVRNNCQSRCGHRHTVKQNNFEQFQVLWSSSVKGNDWGLCYPGGRGGTTASGRQ